MRHNLHATAAAVLQPQKLDWPVWVGQPATNATPPAGTTEHWIGTNGEWTNASLWSGGTVPGAQTTAIIARSGAQGYYTINIDAASAVDVLRVETSSAALTLNSTLQITTLLQMQKGYLGLQGELSGGRLDISSTASVYSSNGTLADIQVHGAITVGSLELDAGVHFGDAGSSAGATLTINGTLDLNGTNTLNNLTLDIGSELGSVIERNSGDPNPAPIIIGSDTIVNVVGSVSQLGNLTGTPDAVVNHGTINAGYSYGLLEVSASSFINDGQINLSNNSVLDFVGDATSAQIARGLAGVTYGGGGVDISGNITGGTVDANLSGGGGTLTNVHYEGTITYAAGISVLDPTLTFAGNTSFAGTDGVGAATIDLAGGVLIFDNGTTLANANVTVQSGDILTSDAQSGAATITIASSTTINVTGSVFFATDHDQTNDMIINHGTIDVAAGATLAVDPNMLTNHGTIDLAAGAYLQLEGSRGFGTFSGLGVNQFVHSLSNDGAAISIDGTMVGGTLNTTLSQGGNYGFLDGVAFEGTINILGSNGLGYLEVDGGTTLAGANGVGRATINVANVTLGVGATATGIDNANINLDGNGTIETYASATFGRSLLITQTGSLASINGTDTVTNNGTIDLAIKGGVFNVENVAKLDNTGTIIIANGEELATFPGAKSPKPITNEGTLSITNGGTIMLQENALSNQASGTMTIVNKSSSVTTIMGDSQSSFANTGTIAVSGGGSTGFALATSNTGSISSAAGTLQFLGSLANSGSISEAGGTTVFSDAVSGTGTIDAASGGTISLLAGSASTQTIDFAGTNSLLDLTSPLTFLGTIVNFGAGNTIDLINTAETGFSFAGGVLTVTDGGATVASLHFTGSYTTASFALGSDNHGGSLITLS